MGKPIQRTGQWLACLTFLSLFFGYQILGSEGQLQLDEAAQQEFIETFYSSWRQGTLQPRHTGPTNTTTPGSFLTVLPMDASPGTVGHTFRDAGDIRCSPNILRDLAVKIFRGSMTPELATVRWEVVEKHSALVFAENNAKLLDQSTLGDDSIVQIVCPAKVEEGTVTVEASLLEPSEAAKNDIKTRFTITFGFGAGSTNPSETEQDWIEYCARENLSTEELQRCREVFDHPTRSSKEQTEGPLRTLDTIPVVLQETVRVQVDAVDYLFDTHAAFERSREDRRKPWKFFASLPVESAERTASAERSDVELSIEAQTVGFRYGKDSRLSLGGAISRFQTEMSSTTPFEAKLDAEGELYTFILSWAEKGDGTSWEEASYKGGLRLGLTYGESQFQQQRWVDTREGLRSQATAESSSRHWHGRLSFVRKINDWTSQQEVPEATPLTLEATESVRELRNELIQVVCDLDAALVDQEATLQDVQNKVGNLPSVLKAYQETSGHNETKKPRKIGLDLLAAIDYEYSEIAPFAETGDTPLRMAIQTQKLDALTLRADIRLRTSFELRGPNNKLMLDGRLGLRHLLSPRERYLEAHWVGLPDLPFTRRVTTAAGTYLEPSVGLRWSRDDLPGTNFHALAISLRASRTAGQRDLGYIRYLFGVHLTWRGLK